MPNIIENFRAFLKQINFLSYLWQFIYFYFRWFFILSLVKLYGVSDAVTRSFDPRTKLSQL